METFPVSITYITTAGKRLVSYDLMYARNATEARRSAKEMGESNAQVAGATFVKVSLL